MRLDQMTVALRVRTPWQAMDLGLRMVRANARAIWGPYFLFAGSIFIASNLLAYYLDAMWLGWFFVWWLKPLFDRIPLHVLSHVTFGNHPKFRETLRAPFQWRFGLWFSWLTYRRFSFWRSMSMPIDILEGLNTERLSLRRSVLIGNVSTQMIGLGFVCILFERLFVASFFTLVYLFVPNELKQDNMEVLYNTLFLNPPEWASLAFNAAFFVSIAIVSPFYVGAGFAAYLNRRTQLEAWDIEIAFKRIAARLKQTSAMLLFLGVMMGGMGFSADSLAQAIDAEPVAEQPATIDTAQSPVDVPDASSEVIADEGDPGSDAAEAAAAAAEEVADSKTSIDNTPKTLQKILGADYEAEPPSFSNAVKKAYKNKDLSPKEKITIWEPKVKPKPQQNMNLSWLEQLLKAASSIVAFLAQYGLWLLLAIVLSWLIWKTSDWMPWLKDKMPAKRELYVLTEKEVMNLDALPSNLSNVVRKLWAQQPRAALALLYRGSVEKLADRLGAPFPPGATEAECVRRSRRLAQPESEANFRNVVRAWQAAAYAHRLPETDEFESLLSQWSALWEKGA